MNNVFVYSFRELRDECAGRNVQVLVDVELQLEVRRLEASEAPSVVRQFSLAECSCMAQR